MTIARDLSELRLPIPTSMGGTGNNGTIASLASNVSWDTVTTPGQYFIPAATGTNVPLAGVNYLLTVVNTPNGLKQTAMLYGNPLTYSRAIVSGSWAAWFKSYDQTNAVGTVSQSGGTPTGAIIEKGSNAQGSYVRYADGTQICWGRLTTTAVNNANGSVFNSAAAYLGNYPAAFASLPVVTATATGVAFAWAGNYALPTVSAWGGWLAMSPTATGGFADIALVAIGRWY